MPMSTKVQGKNLVITVPLTPVKDAPLSGSGKNKVLFTSGGFDEVNGHRINLTVLPPKK